MQEMPSTADGTSHSNVSAASGQPVHAQRAATVDDSACGLVKLFISTLLPDCSVRGVVCGVAVGIAIGFAVLVLAGKIRKAPSSPFRCDDPSLQAAQEKDILPTAPYVALVATSSLAVVVVNELWRPGTSWTDATYWAARHLRRLFLGFVVSGDVAHAIQTVVNAKRPYFIDACQPAVRLSNGTEVLACTGKPVALEPQSGDGRRSESDGGFGERYLDANGDSFDTAMNTQAKKDDFTNDSRPAAERQTQQQAGVDSERRSSVGLVGDSHIVFSIDVPSDTGSDVHSEYRHVDISTWVPPTGDVTNYRCTGPKSRKSGASFPSGHATVAGFGGAFMLGYGIRRFAGFDQPCRAALLASDLGLLVVLVCVQRVVQHKHFPVDVACGSAFGAAVAIVFVTWPYGDGKP
ncbi:hypothetical protein HPB50_011034 [Hyalomma asiaticum]|uniref:Uncharacterized protein n=1 Tax=Hyalomma asiaticum TaxID=266040 RepID=A0ACB7RIQ0_HYAAI|nr:hypothetical protein HPB50_011034 [Hyalomma asiaticum]